ncbi:energy transducer TonB [Lysobacteraceae bacterium NML71-0210]|nr:energy transducer TonB [Xanthomonadaceae bacterium NML71-0210]
MMSSIEVLAWLKYATLVSSAAIALILLLRKPLRRWLGAQAAYALWWLLPLALAGSLLPASKFIATETATALLAAFTIGSDSELHLSQASDDSAVFIGLWLAGMLLMVLWLVWQQSRFVRSLGRLQRRDDGLWLAEAKAGLPALLGGFRPRIVLPADFDVRYDAEEQRLMLLHENAHRQSWDMPGNALAAALRVLFWFNPLLHLAAARFRHDQELACDARVLQQQPQARRIYAGAMLKTHIASVSPPVGCHWGGTHPLKERVMQMQRKLPQKTLRAAGMALAVSLALASGFAAWAMQPATGQLASDAENAHSDDLMIQVIRRPQPVYPPEAMRAGIEGRVRVLVDVNADGTVKDARVSRSAPAGVFDEAALTAVREMRLAPQGKGSSGYIEIAFVQGK